MVKLDCDVSCGLQELGFGEMGNYLLISFFSVSAPALPYPHACQNAKKWKQMYIFLGNKQKKPTAVFLVLMFQYVM